VAILKMHHLDLFAIQMNRQGVVEGQDRQRAFGLGAAREDHGSAVAHRSAGFEPLANVIVRDDWSLLLEVLITVCVVSVVVGINYESNPLVSNLLESGTESCVPTPRTHRRPGRSRRLDICSDVAIFASQQVDIPRNLGNLHLDLLNVLLPKNSGNTSAQQRENSKGAFSHCRSLSVEGSPILCYEGPVRSTGAHRVKDPDARGAQFPGIGDCGAESRIPAQT
jgi:hypothetical protein